MDEKQTLSEKSTWRELLEIWYFKASIAGVVFAVVLGVLNFGFDHLRTKPEQPSADSSNVSAAASTEGDGSAASNAAAGDESIVFNAAAGDGSAVSNAATGDRSTAVNKHADGDYYDFSSMADAPQEQSMKPQDFANYNNAIAYSADLIEHGDSPDTLKFLMEFLKIEDLDEQTKATVEYNCGIYCLHIGNLYQAVVYLQDAASKSNNPYAYYNLGCAYLDSRDPKAEEAFQMALDLSGEPGSTVTLEDQKRFSDALEDAKRWNGSTSES